MTLKKNIPVSIFVLVLGLFISIFALPAKASALAIGDSYRGGIVAYILQAGDNGYDANIQKGLIAAPSDFYASAEYGCYETPITGALGTNIGTGDQNTIDIVASCSTSGIAASLADNLVLGGYSDWYLPSKDELNKLYLNKSNIGGFNDSRYYWSSSRFGDFHAWRQYFNNGAQDHTSKDQTFLVRAIRSFPSAILANMNLYNEALSAVTQNNYTTASWNIYQNVVNANLVTNQDSQAEVDAATLAITNAQKNLAELADLTSYNEVLNSVQQPDYTTASWEVYQAIVDDNVVTDQNSQTEVDAATLAITTAKGNLVVNPISSISIGDEFRGGIVAYILQAGDPGYVAGEVHGLIAAPSDQSNGIRWNNGTNIFVGAESGIGTGNSNTKKIIAAQGDGSYAAKLCADLDLNGYNDWYLPSIGELNNLYLNKDVIGGFITDMSNASFYWSSSEESSYYPYYARFISMRTGSIQNSIKSFESGSVRAVRSFSYTPPATVISAGAISGITAPIMDATPTSTLADTSEYTAIISWSGHPHTFSANTTYTATINITPKAGYTLTGVAANSFTVEGAITTNLINSGVVSAVFPATVNIAVPKLSTSWATSITTVTAVFNGNITNIGGATPTIRGFQYGTTTNYGTTISEEGIFTTGTFTNNKAILTCGTTYHYRAFATNNRTGYGNDKTFKTNSCPTSTWIEKGDTQRYWKSISSSSDGTKLVAVVSGGSIFTSTNRGTTWTERTGAGSRDWEDVTSSSDGTKLAAVVNSGYIYTSTDSGLTWTERKGAGSHGWHSIASSSDGMKLVAGSGYGGDYIYTSTDGGLNWTTNSNSSGQHYWSSVTSSSDGTKLAATSFTYIYTSNNGGITWTERTGAGSRMWNSIASSENGMTLAATGNAEQNSYIYTSTDGGTTWNERIDAGSRRWNSIAASSDGIKLVAVDYLGSVYISTNSGINWIPQPNAGTHQWRKVVSSSDGVKLAAITTDTNYIFTYSAPDAPTTTTEGALNISSNSVTLSGSITGMGGENPTVRGFEYGKDLGYGSTATDNGTYDIGNFSKSISSLECETLYNYRAYSINSGGTGYGNDATFTTSTCPSVGSSGGSSSAYMISPKLQSTQKTLLQPQTVANPIVLSPEEQSLIDTNKQQINNENSGLIAPSIVIGKISRVIKVITKGDDVKIIQSYLNTIGYNCGDSDGIYGNRTKKAVIAFQKEKKLVPDGIIGPKTLKMMK